MISAHFSLASPLTALLAMAASLTTASVFVFGAGVPAGTRGSISLEEARARVLSSPRGGAAAGDSPARQAPSSPPFSAGGI